MCQPESAAAEFEASKLIYEATTGRSQPKDRDVIMYRILQSFKPGETTPEVANQIGYELAMEYTKGQHQFTVYTHEDKAHIHNHIEFNSTNLECDGKFENVKDSVKVLRKLNDKICQAHGLSIPKPKRKKAKSRGEMGAVTVSYTHLDVYKRQLLPSLMFPGDFRRRGKFKAQGRHVHKAYHCPPPACDQCGHGCGGVGRVHRGTGLCRPGLYGFPYGRQRKNPANCGGLKGHYL